MNTRTLTTALALAIGLVFLATLSLTSNDASAQQRTFAADKVYRLSGDFDVEFSTDFAQDGRPTPVGENGTTLVTDVMRIDLLQEWTILSKREAARDITFIVPREKIIYINATE
jgi:hypothetical protein